MSVPQIYLIEPYNAYAPKGRKKHWTEIVEEQALLERIIAEANSHTLPPNSPQVSTPTVGNAAGAGGSPLVAYFSPRMTAAFTVSPATSSAPSQFTFVNSSNADLMTQGVATFLWTFGDGTTTTDAQPLSHIYTTTGSNFNVTLLVTSVATGVTASVTQSINVPAPTVTANYSLSSNLTASTTTNITTSVASASITFINTTTTNNSSNPITYVWNFGSGSVTSSLATPPVITYTATGSYTVRLSATGSFGITSAATRVALLVIS